MKIAFYSCTRKDDISETFSFKSLKRLENKIDFLYDENNTLGLSERYNLVLKEYASKFDIIVFLHDDVYVDDLSVCEKLEHAHKTLDIVGLAGGINPVIKEPALWHIMCGGFHSGNLRGAVAHNISKDQIAMTSFGPTPSRATVLDGLFISVKTECYTKKLWKFNENYKFHHYDIASCIDANRMKLKLGVVPVWVVHNSPGLSSFNDKGFQESQKIFLNEYSLY